jgi:hypothetical protein
VLEKRIPPLRYGMTNWRVRMVDGEREMLREEDEAKLGERRPFDSARQATYEDTVAPASGWAYEDADDAG